MTPTPQQQRQANRFRFRAWDKEAKKMIDVWCLELGQNGKILVNDQVMIPTNDLMQSTGRPDRTRKEIFEGDIVIQVAKSGSGQTSREVGTVTWDSEGCDYNIEGSNGFKAAFGFSKSYIEIIGNRFENPDFLSSHP